MRIIDFDTFIDMPRANVDWLIDGLIPKPGMIELMGPPKIGKSFLSLDIAFKVSRREPFLNANTKKSRVLYFQLDTSEMILRDRGVALRESGYDTSSPNFGMVHPEDAQRPVDVMLASGREYFAKALKIHAPDLVVLDTLRECHQEDENDSTAMKRVMDTLEGLFAKTALLLLHHTSKFPPEIVQPNPILASRGSSYITGKVDAYWLMYGDKFTMTSRWDETRTLDMKQSTNGMFEFSGDIQPKEHDKVAQIAELIASPEAQWKSRNELMKMARAKYGINERSFYRLTRGQI